MDAEEVKDHLKSIINSLIKDNAEEANKELHDVLAAKMRDRISPEANDGDDSNDGNDSNDDGDTKDGGSDDDSVE